MIIMIVMAMVLKLSLSSVPLSLVLSSKKCYAKQNNQYIRKYVHIRSFICIRIYAVVYVITNYIMQFAFIRTCSICSYITYASTVLETRT